MKITKFGTIESAKFLDEGAGAIEGYASTFGPPPDRVGDIVMEGAFGEQSFSVPLLAYHDAERPIGSARITPDMIGARLTAGFAMTDTSQEMRTLVCAGAVPGLSIGYKDLRSEPNDSGGVNLYAIDLMEVSVVPIPANRRALVTLAKSIELEDEEEIKDPEPHCRGGHPGHPAEADDELLAVRKAATALLLAYKRGARNSTKDQDMLDAAHDAIVQAGANCGREEYAAEVEDGKGLDLDLSVIEFELGSLRN